jgi:hypothetical protein
LHHLAVLRHVWKHLRPGGRIVIMDGKLPHGRGAKLALPFGLWLMKHTLLGNPLIQPWTDLAAIANGFAMQEFLFGSRYACWGMKSAGLQSYEHPSEAEQLIAAEIAADGVARSISSIIPPSKRLRLHAKLCVAHELDWVP